TAPGSLLLADLAACAAPTLCGIEFQGESADDLAGWAVTGLGDVNGDGFADLAIGAPGASPGGRTGAGKVYLIEGPLLAPGVIPLSTVGVTRPGLVFLGEGPGDAVGTSVSAWPRKDSEPGSPDDLLMGAPLADANDEFGNMVPDAGYVYAVHGGTAN